MAVRQYREALTMTNLAENTIAPPLETDQLQRVHEAVVGLSSMQLQWISGYVAGLGASATIPAIESAPGQALTILYGSQTGNGEGIARALASRGAESGFRTVLHSLADYRPANLKRESLVVFVVSTHGEGDPPDDAELFHEFLLSERAPKLPDLHYAVLALGDSAYLNFCETGHELDARLEQLGGSRLLPITECDVAYEEAAASWSDAVVAGLPDWLDAAPVTPHLRAVETKSAFGRENPFRAPVLVNQKITGRGSSKEVRHVELSIEGSGLTYEPGDSLAVVATNPPQLVDEFLEFLGVDGEKPVLLGNETTSLVDALTQRLEITVATPTFVRAWSKVAESRELKGLLGEERRKDLDDLLREHQVIDIVRRFPAQLDAQQFVAMLRKLTPRSYSIASSLRANPDEVHLTVAAVRYEAFGTEHWGAASTHIADRVEAGGTLAVYVDPNTRFRLPTDDSTDIIMIGPGTGIAPFRAFVQERAERGASGRNWLIFGDRNFSSDFLYQLEWHRHLKQGSLQQLDIAFSRDQDDKVYVQDRIRERAAELYAWIESGAVVYVCGDAKHMAGEVDDALVDVIAAGAGLDRDAAASRLAELRRDGRYRRDVY